MPALDEPQALGADHELAEFDSGVAALDAWLKLRARHNEAEGASRTYVCCKAGSRRVAGFYSVAAASIEIAAAPGSVRRNMPDPIPVAVIGRLGVDRAFRGAGLGRALMRHALGQARLAASAIGIRAIMVHAKSAEARAFYVSLGMISSTAEPMTLLQKLGAPPPPAARN